MSPGHPRFAAILLWLRWPLLVVGIVLAVVTFGPARRLDFDRSIENMFAPDDPLLPPYGKLKRVFGGNEIVMVAYRDEGLLASDGSGIQRLATLSDELKRATGVKDCLSLAEIEQFVRLRLRGNIAAPDDPVARGMRDLFEGYTHGADGNTAAVVCILVPEREAAADRRGAIAGIRAAADAFGREHDTAVMVAGEPVMVTDGFRYVEDDGRRLGIWSTVLLGLTIVACFRSLRWMLIPIAVVQLSLLATRATLVWSGRPLSMVSSMLTAIVTVVGVATVVHVIVRYQEGRLQKLATREALLRAMAIVAAPVFWACATDAVGFGSLLLAHVGPVRDFGLMMAVGSLLVPLCAALLLPGMASAPQPRFLARVDLAENPQPGGELERALSGLMNWVHRRPITTLVATVALAAIAIAGTMRVEVESNFTRNFRRGSPVVRSYDFIEANLGGAGVWDVIVPAPPPDKLDWKYLESVLVLEDRLRSEVQSGNDAGEGGDASDGRDVDPPALTKVVSLADAVETGAQIDRNSLYVPLVRNFVVRTVVNEMYDKMPAFTESMYGEDPDEPGRYYLRIMLRAREQQASADKQQIIEQVRTICREEFPGDANTNTPPAEVTGYFVLLAQLIHSIVRDQWITFAAAAAGIGVMLLIAFRSPLLAAIALVPNVLPILMVLGLVGWVPGMKLNMGAAMIAAVSMGLSVDSSIHYVTALRRARAEGLSTIDALARVQPTVGRAMVLSTLALIVGFSVLCASDFVPTIYFGLLVSLAMLGGLLGNLVVLPLLIKLTSRG